MRDPDLIRKEVSWQGHELYQVELSPPGEITTDCNILFFLDSSSIFLLNYSKFRTKAERNQRKSIFFIQGYQLDCTPNA